MNKFILSTIVIAIVLGLLGCFLPFGGTSIVEKTIEKTAGALAGPDIPYPYISVGGVSTEYRSQNMITATTSLCAMLSPAATSTLTHAGWIITGGTTTAATIDLATSTTAFSTTTNLVSATSVDSAAQGVASWTASGGDGTDAIVAPNTYVNVMTAGAGLGGYTYTGKCYAEFRTLR